MSVTKMILQHLQREDYASTSSFTVTSDPGDHMFYTQHMDWLMEQRGVAIHAALTQVLA